MERITLERAVEALTEIVEAEGRDYVYSNPYNEGSCQYFHVDPDKIQFAIDVQEEDLQPGCLVGQVLVRLGVPKLAIYPYNDVGVDSIVGLDIDDDALEVLSAAQEVQDDFQPWGAALDSAMTRVSDQRITHEDVLRVMAEVVEEYGQDYVYQECGEMCVYIKGGKPSCLIGHVLVRLGVDVGFLTDRNSSRISSHKFSSWGGDLPWTGLATRVMQAAQSIQDTGGTWGRALAAASSAAQDSVFA
jgi:hypothetical protein